MKIIRKWYDYIDDLQMMHDGISDYFETYPITLAPMSDMITLNVKNEISRIADLKSDNIIKSMKLG